MRISDWSSDVCSSDLRAARRAVTRTSACVLALVTATAAQAQETPPPADADAAPADIVVTANKRAESLSSVAMAVSVETGEKLDRQNANGLQDYVGNLPKIGRHTSELQSLMRISYAVFFLKKTNKIKKQAT